MSQALSQPELQSKRRRFAPNTLPCPPSHETSQAFSLVQSMSVESTSQDEIETQLLQVGMRVRKAVAEGYQIPGKRAFTPRPFFNSNRLSSSTAAALSNEEEYTISKQPLSTATFCGISLAALAHISSAPVVEEQTLWTYSTASKRRQHFDDESDSDDSQEFMPRTPQLACADSEVFFPQDCFSIDFDGLDESVGYQEPPRAKGRKIAQPRLRRGRLRREVDGNPFAQLAQSAPRFDHQRARSCGIDAMDFGEAVFLQPRHDVEMDCS